ncbi:hypothetical protein CBFG_00852 [Clostridiales bacterium 1_7_47FAA]|nr:hypothetical protein CBFG_00852 [Clostridiales bacterium 1_7_47FAA]
MINLTKKLNYLSIIFYPVTKMDMNETLGTVMGSKRKRGCPSVSLNGREQALRHRCIGKPPHQFIK